MPAKTTLFNVVTGFYRGDRGSVSFDGQQVSVGRRTSSACRGWCDLQIAKALAAMPVIDNMMLAAPNQPGSGSGTSSSRPRASRAREEAIQEQAMELLELFNLTKLADDYAGTLSGGQRKLSSSGGRADDGAEAAPARRADGGINPTLGARLLDHMQRLRRERG